MFQIRINQGIAIKGKEMALVWHKKASRTCLQSSLVLQTHSFETDTQHDYSQGNCRTMSSIIVLGSAPKCNTSYSHGNGEGTLDVSA